MKKLGYSIITLATVLSLTGVASAQGGYPPPYGGMPPRGDHPGYMGTRMMGSTTGEGHFEGVRMAPPPALGLRGIIGVVTAVESTSFLIDARGRNGATTTFTVNFTTSTKFINGTSTGSVGDLGAGTMVKIEGRVATSTNTISANVVHYGKRLPMPFMHGEKRGFFNGVGNFFGGIFGGKGSSTPPQIGSTTAPGAAAEGNPGFMGRLFQHLFGWMM